MICSRLASVQTGDRVRSDAQPERLGTALEPGAEGESVAVRWDGGYGPGMVARVTVARLRAAPSIAVTCPGCLAAIAATAAPGTERACPDCGRVWASTEPASAPERPRQGNGALRRREGTRAPVVRPWVDYLYRELIPRLGRVELFEHRAGPVPGVLHCPIGDMVARSGVTAGYDYLGDGVPQGFEAQRDLLLRALTSAAADLPPERRGPETDPDWRLSRRDQAIRNRALGQPRSVLCWLQSHGTPDAPLDEPRTGLAAACGWALARPQTRALWRAAGLLPPGDERERARRRAGRPRRCVTVGAGAKMPTPTEAGRRLLERAVEEWRRLETNGNLTAERAHTLQVAE